MEKQIGPYQIVRLIGAGGMGSVYEGLHAQIQRRGAIKVLHKEFQQDAEFVHRFFNEARAVNIINHPSIVSIYDFGTTAEGAPYIVMEYLEGESLRQRLSSSGRLAPEAAVRIGKQVASGLAAAHTKQVVHRDLKPVNIMMVPDTDNSDGERAKILDFGIAKVASDSTTKALTRLGVSLGTPAYMSPEQCKSARDVADRSDVYALGIILFELIAGAHPFAEARADSAMMASHIGKEPPALDSLAPGISSELALLVKRMLAKQPDARPSAAEVASTLGRLSGSTTGLMPIVPQNAAALAESPSMAVAPVAPSTANAAVRDLLRKLKGGNGVIAIAGAALLIGLLGLILVGRVLFFAPAAGPEQTRWSIASQPAGAEILNATGQIVGKTPFQYTVPRGTGIEILSLRFEGYAEQRVPVDRGRDGIHSVTLAPLPPPAASNPAVEAKDPANHGPTRKKHKPKHPSRPRK